MSASEPTVSEKQLVHYRVEEGVAIFELNDPPANTYYVRDDAASSTRRSWTRVWTRTCT